MKLAGNEAITCSTGDEYRMTGNEAITCSTGIGNEYRMTGTGNEAITCSTGIGDEYRMTSHVVLGSGMSIT